MEVLLYVCTPRKSTDVTVPVGGAMYGNLWVPHRFYIEEVIVHIVNKVQFKKFYTYC